MPGPQRHRFLTLAAALALAASLLIPVPAAAQLGPRTIGNTGIRGLDAGGIGDQLNITSSDRTRHKMELIRELEYLEPDAWRSASVTWLAFEHNDDGSVTVTEEGAGVVRDLAASKKWQVEPLEGGGWKLTPAKSGGKMDLYLETVFRGEPFKVGAVVPKFDERSYGAVYRGTDFLFFVVQKKHPEEGAG